jgi:hypothetical protein
LAQVLRAQLGRGALDLNERHQLPGDPHAVAGELPLDLVFGVVFVFVVAGPIAREIGDQQPGVTLITRVLPAFTGSGGLANWLFL